MASGSKLPSSVSSDDERLSALKVDSTAPGTVVPTSSEAVASTAPDLVEAETPWAVGDRSAGDRLHGL